MADQKNSKEEFMVLSAFCEGLALAKKDGKFGYINTKRKVVIPFEYDYIGSFKNGLCNVEKNGRSYKIDRYNRPYYKKEEYEVFYKTEEEINKIIDYNNERIEASEDKGNIAEITRFLIDSIKREDDNLQEQIKILRAKAKAKAIKDVLDLRNM